MHTPAAELFPPVASTLFAKETVMPHDRHHEPRRGRQRRRQGGDAQIPATVELVTLTIDGVEVSVPKGTLIIRAAEQIGIADPAVLRPPAARPGRRLPAVPGRGRHARPGGSLRPMPKPQASCTIDGQPRAWWSRPSSPRRSPTRRSTA